MSKKAVCCIAIAVFVIAALILGIFVLTNQFARPPHEQVYIDFIEQMQKDMLIAIDQYVHYEDPWEAQLSRESATFVIDHYEIIEIEQMSDKLWRFHAFLTHGLRPNGYYVNHFVGIIDGEYRVMTAVRHIPADLQEGADLAPYITNIDDDL